MNGGLRVVSRGDLRVILRAHADSPTPTGLRYFELPHVLGEEDWLRLDDEHRGWYEARYDGLVLIDFLLQPGSYDAWVVEA